MRTALAVIISMMVSLASGQESLDTLTQEFAKKEGLDIVRKGDVKVVQYESPDVMADTLKLPKLDGKNTVVARCDLLNGIIHLGRKGEGGREDFYYEMAKWRFWPITYKKDHDKWKEVADRFMRLCVDRDVR